ncbi:Clustered mitochondria protein-like [Hondaea fermentalgiana]|uniref:Clustered mitochondria protein-like n=1 Tax=Hondaea fermentalgiana TaxID=2315210 RepID=A0A2R5G1Y6_9STRA|nr:Clustered mitochondria protein-like [Hondaea fermentalgiana]|eukprot:GBG24319.1 Clustered mitochondria protein-like [Hondaea fermentalgiana]
MALAARLRAAQKRTGTALESLRGSRAEPKAESKTDSAAQAFAGHAATVLSAAGLLAVREALAKGDLAGDVQLATVTDAGGGKELVKDESVILTDASSYPNFKCAKRARPKRRINVHASAIRTKSKQEWTLEDVADFARTDAKWDEVARPTPLNECASESVVLLLVGPTCVFSSLVATVEAYADTRDVAKESLLVYVHMLDCKSRSDASSFWMQDAAALLRGSNAKFGELGLVLDRFAAPPTSVTMAHVWAAHVAEREGRVIKVLASSGLTKRMRAQLPEQGQTIFAWISAVRVELCRYPSLCSSNETSESICETNAQLEAEILRAARATGLDLVSGPLRSALMGWAVQSSRVVLERFGNRVSTSENPATQLQDDALVMAQRARTLAETTAHALVHSERWADACEVLDAALRFESTLRPDPKSVDSLSTSQLLCHRARCCGKLGRAEAGLQDALRADGLLTAAADGQIEEDESRAAQDLCHVDALQLRADLERQRDAKNADFKQEALNTLVRLLEVKTKVFGQEHPEVLATSEAIVDLELELRQGSAAILSAVKALQLSKQLNGEKHPHTARCYNLMGRAMAMQLQTSEATKMLNKAIEIHASIFGEKDPRLEDFRRDLANVQ